MEKIIYKNDILDYFCELVYLPFKKKYISSQENLEKYLEKLVQFLSQNIKDFLSRKNPGELNYLDSHYIFSTTPISEQQYIFFSNSQLPII